MMQLVYPWDIVCLGNFIYGTCYYSILFDSHKSYILHSASFLLDQVIACTGTSL